MLALKNCDYDCTTKCRQSQHANSIVAALTKRSISDDKLAAFIAKTCANFGNIQDDLGRSAVHMCASVARYRILEWLLNFGANINKQDIESGSTPLHRALYYGNIDCAVLLLRYGAKLELLDEDTRCPLQAICRKSDVDKQTESQNEVLVWGSNKNYNLGIGNEQNTNTPQAVDFFRKSNLSIEHVALGAYHSLFYDKKGYLYAVGHGKGGRLGVGIENIVPEPTRVKVHLKYNTERIICISVSQNHSLMLSSRSLVYACGANDDHQLGVRDVGESLTTFREVVALRDKGACQLQQVIACDQHSIAYGPSGVYIWGANLGQFGINSDTTTIPAPKLMKLPEGRPTRMVASNSAATVIYSAQRFLYLFYEYAIRIIKPPNFEDLKTLEIMGGDVKNAAKGSAAALKLIMLTKSNVVYFWYETTLLFYRCDFAPIRMLEIKKIVCKGSQMLVLSEDGYVYTGKCNQIALPAESQQKRKRNLDIWQKNDPSRSDVSRKHYIRINLQRIWNIDRAIDIISDEGYSSFAVLQESQKKYYRRLPIPRTNHGFKKLYHDTSESDALHDVVFHVDGEIFAAHKFIIFSRSAGLRELINCYLDKDVYLNFENLTGKMFELVLKFIYTYYWPTEDDLDCILQSFGPNNPQKRSRVCEMFATHLEKFQLNDLAKYILGYVTEKKFAVTTKQRANRLRRTDYPELYDIRISCENGEVLDAHKCILVARLEYFEMMFMHSWSEQTTVNFSGVPVEYMTPILDYLYSLDNEAFCKQNYPKSVLYNMICICDQYFIEPLQNLCESLIFEKISIHKCREMLEFALMYNCKLLQKGCLDFICENLARVLCYRIIEECEPETLKHINEHYKKMFHSVFDFRQITPFSEAIEDEPLLSFVEGCEVNLDYRMDMDASLKATAKQPQKELHSKQDARHYEQQAISSMMKSLSVSESPASGSDLTPTTAAVSSPNEAKNWSKVVDKKELKRKLAETAFKVNNLLKQEEEPGQELVAISPRSILNKTPINEHPPAVKPTSPSDASSPLSKIYNLDLSTLMAQSQKLSQKQRKRLSSEPQSWRASSSATLELSNTPVAIPNAWGIATSPPATYPEPFSSPPTGSSSDPTSFANMMRGQPAAATAISSPDQNNSFSKILADEKRQRDSYERMRNKSLVHTQIEETAIAELREFYNVDNTDDETITIERKSRPNTINFSTWRKH